MSAKNQPLCLYPPALMLHLERAFLPLRCGPKSLTQR